MDYAYEELGNHIIRPYRETYQIKDLGQNQLTIANQQVIRQDVSLMNPYNQLLQCSLYSIIGQQNAPCVLYCHCNSGNRLEGTMYLNKLVENGLQLCCFDFHGCGNSDGNYISLGFYESWDIETIVNFLKRSGINKILLWGRSMGSVASLIYASRDPYITGLVLDSPFKSLKQMMLELSKKHYSLIPKFLLSYIINQIEKYIQKTAHFQYKNLEMKQYANNCQMYAIFITSKEDQIVNHKQVNQLYQEYNGNKQIIYTNGGHTNYRNEELQQEIISMLKLQVLKDYSIRNKFKGNYLNFNRNYSKESNLRSCSPQQQSFFLTIQTPSVNYFQPASSFPMTSSAYFTSNHLNQSKQQQQPHQIFSKPMKLHINLF